jgi:hypothetical protein
MRMGSGAENKRAQTRPEKTQHKKNGREKCLIVFFAQTITNN